MNRLFWIGIACTLVLAIISSFNTDAIPNKRPVRPPVRPAAKPGPPPPSPAKPAAAPPAKPTAAPAKPATMKVSSGPTTKRPHDELGVMIAATAPILFGVIGEIIGQILHYIAS
ncbi:unnamed protein product [Trichobilharzia szidati]|nr:unnamed protein product [Trichobilharzia szidati]CAH8825189.1 unnamed protein product [Trichobilharzia szidati]